MKKTAAIANIVLVLLTVLLVILSLQQVSFSDEGILIMGAPAVDENVQAEVDPGQSEQLRTPESASSSSLEYALTASVDSDTGTIDMYFRNPSESAVNAAVSLILTDESGREAVIAKSGLIPAGATLETMTLSSGVKLAASDYAGEFHVDFYSPQTGDAATLGVDLTGVTIKVR